MQVLQLHPGEQPGEGDPHPPGGEEPGQGRHRGVPHLRVLRPVKAHPCTHVYSRVSRGQRYPSGASGVIVNPHQLVPSTRTFQWYNQLAPTTRAFQWYNQLAPSKGTFQWYNKLQLAPSKGTFSSGTTNWPHPKELSSIQYSGRNQRYYPVELSCGTAYLV